MNNIIQSVGLNDFKTFGPSYNALAGFNEYISTYSGGFSIRLKFAINMTGALKLLGLAGCRPITSYTDGLDTFIWSVLGFDGGYCTVTASDKWLSFYVFTQDKEVYDSFVKSIRAVFKPFEYEFVAKESPYIPTEFYQMTSSGPDGQTQKLLCPKWEEIRGNYNSGILQPMDKLVADKFPWLGGRLIIINGPPGCGKTYFIRSLIRAWKDIFAATVILDPEQLASNPLYYFGISGDPYEGESDGSGNTKPPKPRLLIMEDCADLIMTESRASHYDKVGKLLNMTDGLLGQGRNDVFLISFNEEIEDIDPAFKRPGRLLMALEVPKLEYDDSVKWLKEHNHSGEIDRKRHSLAELYAIITDNTGKIIKAKEKLGFK